MNMKNDKSYAGRSLIAVAVALAFPSAPALADEVQDMINPDKSDVSLRIQHLNKVNPLYRMYTGADDKGVTGSFGVDVVRRNAEGGWLKLQGRDLGVSGIQELGASYEKQGDWRIGLNYNEITKFAPYTINTKVAGVGTDRLTLNPDWRSSGGLGGESSLKLERTATSLTGSKLLSDAFKFSFSFKTEDKKGAIMSSSYGSTWNNPNGSGKNYGTQYFAPQPENYKHNQFEATLDYFTKTLQLSGGYYGSFFKNDATALNIIPGNNSIPTLTGAAAGPSAIPWISLPPDNEAQQLFLSGAYNLSDKTRLSFKWSKERNTQDDSFIPAYGATTGATYASTNPPGVPYSPLVTNSSLGGLVDTTAYFAMLTSRLSKDLDLLASWRYEDRDDKTPQRLYLDNTANAIEYPNGVFNPHESHKISRGKLELGYRLPQNYRLIGGLDYEQKKTPDTMRDEVTDKTIRVEVRKSMGETLNGSFKLSSSNRTGGAWHLPDGTPAAGATTFSTTTGVAAPLQFVDRKREKAKLMLDWNPVDALSLQVFYERGKDSYPFSPPSGNARMGLTDGKTELYGLDVGYKINDNWRAQGFASYNQSKTHQNEVYTTRRNGVDQDCTGTTATTSCTPWTADLNLEGTVFGASVKGSIARWDVGADYLFSKDTTAYSIGFSPNVPTAAGSAVPFGAGVLPDTLYKLNRLKLYGTFAYSKQTRFRIDYIYDQRRMDDYTWSNWTFSDGTRVNVEPKQTSQLLGVTVIQSF